MDLHRVPAVGETLDVFWTDDRLTPARPRSQAAVNPRWRPGASTRADTVGPHTLDTRRRRREPSRPCGARAKRDGAAAHGAPRPPATCRPVLSGKLSPRGLRTLSCRVHTYFDRTLWVTHVRAGTYGRDRYWVGTLALGPTAERALARSFQNLLSHLGSTVIHESLRSHIFTNPYR